MEADEKTGMKISEDQPDDTEKMSWAKRMKKRLSLAPEGTTPPNWRCIVIIFVALFSSSFSLTFLFPFLPDMVLSFGHSEEEKGYYVGFIASSVFGGRIFGSFFWGWLSDVKGRKIVLLLTIVLNGIFSLLFGFSVNVPMAMVLRFLAGLTNGTVVAAKTVLYEISDNTNQAVGMSTISLAWGSGLILGPAIGGYLASPAQKYPHVFDESGFLGQYRFVLPSIVAGFISSFGFVIVLWKFEETLHIREVEIIHSEEEKDAEDQNKLTVERNGRLISSERLSPSVESLQQPHPAISCEDLHCDADAGMYLAHLETEVHAGKDDDVFDTHSESKNEHSHAKEPTSIENNKNTLPTNKGKEEDETSSERKEIFVCSSHNGMSSHLRAMEDQNDMQRESSDLASKETESGVDNCDEKTSLFEGVGTQPSVTVIVEMVDVCKKMSVSSKGKSRSCSSCSWSIRNNRLVQLLSLSDVRQAVMIYTIFSFGVIGFEDLFTIFASTEPRLDGLGFNTDEIGTSLGMVSVPMLFLQLFLYPTLVRKLGIKKTFIIWSFVLILTVQLIPVSHLLYDNKVWLWVLLVVLLIPERIAVNCCFSGTSLMINNSATPQNAGTVNGIAMTATAIARTLAPTVGGSIFAWSVSYGTEHLGPPFDVNLAFAVFGLVFMISCIQCVVIPEHLNRQTKRS